MPNYFLFLLLLIAALSHAICHSILKYNKNALGVLGITSIIEIIIFTPLVLTVPFPTPLGPSTVIIFGFKILSLYLIPYL